MRRALIVVDVQNDFCEGGALPVTGGAEVARRIYEYILNWSGQYDAIAFTKDWHNALPDTNGGHFVITHDPDYVNTWPVHCVADTYGSQFHHTVYAARVLAGRENIIFYKGQGKPDYSGFQGVNTDGVDLDTWLLDYDISDVDVVGIAGDFCVKATALDAKRFGYDVRILPEYVASVGGAKATLEVIAELEAL